jgi:hypothetical protein
MTFSVLSFSWGREGRIKREGRPQHDGDEVESGARIMPADHQRKMKQGVQHQEGRSGNRGRPVPGSPGPRGQGEASDQERRANVLDEVRIIRPGFGRARHARVPVRARDQHHHTVEDGRNGEKSLRSTSAWEPPAPKTSGEGSM